MNNESKFDGDSEFERQSAFSRAMHSIRTRYSLMTAAFLLCALAAFYVGGRIVLVHLIRDAEQQVKDIGLDIARITYRNAETVRKNAKEAFADNDFSRFSLMVEFADDGSYLKGSASREQLSPYAEPLHRWIFSMKDRKNGESPSGILRIGGVSHCAAMYSKDGGYVLLGIPFDTSAFTAGMNESFSGLDVRVSNRRAEITITEPTAAVRYSQKRSGFGIAPMISEAINFYSGGFWNLGNNPFEAVFAIRDIAGNAISMISVSIPRTFSYVTRTAIGRLAFFVAVCGLLLVLPIFWFQSRILLNPLTKMTDAVSKIGEHTSDTDCPRLEWHGRDEFALLALSVNRMLEALSRRSLAVAQTESRHQALIDCLPDSLAIFDPVGRLVAISKRAEGFLPIPGFTPGEVPSADVFGYESVSNFLSVLGDTFRNGTVGKARLKVQRAPGVPRSIPTRHFELRFTRMDEYFAMVIVRDVSEEVAEHKLRVSVEERMSDSRKRESLTLLAAGIAHDMNNVLSVVLSSAETIGTTSSSASSALTAIRESVKKGSSMMRELMTFAGESRISLSRLSPRIVFDDLKPLVGRVVGRNVEVSYEIDDDLPEVDADPNQFWKVLFNIVKNAGEAIGSAPGHISIAATRFVMTESIARTYISERSLTVGPGTLFTISDDGPGINSEILSRLFDPFVSSKSLGRGLGLATVRTIVEAHGGGIEVTSEIDRGTTFKIFLPESKLPRPAAVDASAIKSTESNASALADAQAATVSGVVLTAESLEARKAVLVVDDEEAIRKTASILVKSFGMIPFVASDNQEAMAIVRRQANALRVIILDADLGGVDTVRLLGSFRISAPGVPIIVSSGSAEDSIAKLFANAPYDDFLAKPYTMVELRKKILS